MTFQENARDLARAEAWRHYHEAVRSGKDTDYIMMRLRAALALDAKEKENA